MVVVRDGLRAGDELVVRGQRELTDGAAVAVYERAESWDGSLPSDPDVVKFMPEYQNGGTGDVRVSEG